MNPLNNEALALQDVLAHPTEPSEEDLSPVQCADAEIDMEAAEAAEAAPISSYTLLTEDDLRAFSPPQWIIKGVLPSHGLVVVFGPSGSGKSFLVLDMLQSLALGKPWFERRVTPRSVTYVVLEGEAGLAKRVEAYRLRHGASSLNIRYVAEPFSLLVEDHIDNLLVAIQAAGVGDVVVLDTLSRAMSGADENDGKIMGAVIAAAKVVHDTLRGLVLLVHHTGKDASRGMRGHSSLIAAVDCAIEVKRRGDEREWMVAKSKDGEDGASQPFKLEVVNLGTDSDGDAITSCVVVPMQSAQPVQPVATKLLKLGGHQSIAYKALQAHLGQSATTENGGAPPGVAGIQLDQAVGLVAPLIPVDVKRQKERAKDAIKGLITNGYFDEVEEWLTIPHPAPQP